jgi:uncharacterized protein
MTENLTISKAPPTVTSMDFAALRKAGIEYLEKMGTSLWTDFNLHDPGITILEVLCYAITDLGYRTNFSIQDILASSQADPGQKQFFTAQEILTCNPVTVNDFRKILIDLDGIKNAWLVKTANQEVLINQGADGELVAVLPNGSDSDIQLNGLYDVYIDLDDIIDHNDLEKVDDIIACAWQKLWKYRNLCEDYVTVNVIEEMEFCIDAEVELCPGADVNKVTGDIYYYIQEFLTPTIQFYNFQEMYEQRKRSCEEIFEGPILCNGFIDDADLDKAQLRLAVYKSDIWQVIMDVCGVAGIKKLNIKKGADTLFDDTIWCIEVDDYHKPKLNIDCSQIVFQQGFDCVYPDESKVLERITLLQKLNHPVKKSQQRPAVQAGIDRDLEEYFTIQNDFPAVYKIAEGQIISQDNDLRKAQAKQLKGYLMLFDELLANYLLLLSRVKDLLSVSQPEDHTYFYQTLYDIPGVRDLIKAFPVNGTGEEWEAFKNDSDNDYVTKLKEIIETETKRKQRKNIFLDHLLARFGETFSGYAVNIFKEQCNCMVSQEGILIEDELLKDKAAFLQRIPELSSERGKGFNYKALDCGRPDVWDSYNVEGVKKRVCMYLGFDDYKRKRLTCDPEFDVVPYRTITDGKVQAYRLRLQDKEKNILLDGIKNYRLQQNAVKDAKDLKEQVLRHVNVHDPADPSKGIVIVLLQNAQGYSRVQVKDREGNFALQSDMLEYDNALLLREKILAFAFPESCAVEGFHIVEHILLRPKDDDYTPLFDPVSVSDGISTMQVYDPYSFWITVVIPNWLPQYKDNPNAQNAFEQLVRRETPAHIVAKFCWLDPKEMYRFESAYLQWLYENALEQPNERELTEHVNDLVKIMKECMYTIRDTTDPCLEDNTNTGNDG